MAPAPFPHSWPDGTPHRVTRSPCSLAMHLDAYESVCRSWGILEGEGICDRGSNKRETQKGCIVLSQGVGRSPVTDYKSRMHLREWPDQEGPGLHFRVVPLEWVSVKGGESGSRKAR